MYPMFALPEIEALIEVLAKKGIAGKEKVFKEIMKLRNNWS
jgi:hypothetical protein